jgi:site-specific recombinase XerD
MNGKPNRKCEWCKTAIYVEYPKKKRVFCDETHKAEWTKADTLQRKAGRFRKLMAKYFQFAEQHYKPQSYRSTRCDLLRFCEFLNENQIRSMGKVKPQTITAYITWARKRCSPSINHSLGAISVFMRWLQAEGYRKECSPVIANIHVQGYRSPGPRPYTESDLSTIWEMLRAHGGPADRAAVALGQESGLRIGETCNLRLEDVDLEQQRVFIRLPNKTSVERWAPFSEKAKVALAEWLAVRPKTKHSHLFCNARGQRMGTWVLTKRLNRVICRPGGLPKFSYHRLRHSMASGLLNAGVDTATVMAIGGWRSHSGMSAYAKLKPETIRRSYDEAMKKVRASQTGQPSKILSLQEFAAAKANPPTTLAATAG